MLKEFRDFVMRGNVIDLAIGIIIGAAFNDVVNSLVDNIIMAPLGAILGRVDFSEYYINLSGGEYGSLAEAQEAGAATVNYGLFIGALITFLIIALAVFLIIKAVNRAQAAMPKSEAEADDEEISTKECPYCFTNIPARAVRCPNCTTELEMAASGLD